MVSLRILVLLSTMVCGVAQGASLGKAEFSVDSKNVVLELTTDSDLSKVSTITVTLSPADGLPELDLDFDARMPEHNHGMVVKPRVHKKTANVFEISGVKLHMPGKWQFEVVVRGTKKSSQSSIFKQRMIIDYFLNT